MKIEFKNVQRRVYDALNVLSALNIIVKDKSRVEWVGIFQDKDSSPLKLEPVPVVPENARQECTSKIERSRLAKFAEKRRQLAALKMQISKRKR